MEKSSQKVHIDSKAFARMKKLRILKIVHPLEFVLDFELKDFNVDFSGSLDFLSNELSLLYWHGRPFKFLPSNFYPERVVAIDLSYSQIQSLWTVPKSFRSLKVIKLRYCRKLTSTPDFTEITNLEELYLDACVNLVKVHPSIGMLKRLVVLDMRDCTRLRSFPCKVEMDSLQVLILSGCKKMDKLPEVLGTLITLVELHVDGTAITEFPFFIFTLTNLQALSIDVYQRTESRWWTPIFQKQPQSMVLPSLASFCFLSDLRFSNCNISEVSPDIGTLSSLRHLDLSKNSFTTLPGSLSQLSELGILTLDGCMNLEVLPELPPNIYCLFASDCTALRELPGRITVCRSFLSCHFIGCPNLFRNVTIESQVSMSYPRNQLSSMLQYM